MKHIHFDVESDGFYGAYWVCKDRSDCTVIVMLGDDPEDYMARSAVKWLIRLGVNVLTMSPGRYGDMQAFVQKLRDMGYERVELMDTTDGSFMTPKEARRLMLRGSTLLVGRK